jgi:hypothetical protein
MDCRRRALNSLVNSAALSGEQDAATVDDRFGLRCRGYYLNSMSVRAHEDDGLGSMPY